MTVHTTLLPPGWPRPKGYANGVLAKGSMVFVAGIIGWDTEGKFEAGFLAQFRKTLENTVAILAEAGAEPTHITRMTWYLTDRDIYLNNLAEVGQIYKEVIGRVFPAMAVVQVAALMEDKALVEIETTAVVPD